VPIYASSAFEFDSIEQGISIFSGEKTGYVYGRYGNPNSDSVAQKISKLETFSTSLEANAVLTSSGMNAIYLALFSILSENGVLIAQENLYGGTTELLQKVVENQGHRVIYTDLRNPEQLETLFRQNDSVKAVYFETPTNPDLSITDIQQVTDIAHSHGAKVILDNTFATPYLQQGFLYGVDVVVHSTTKYLNGHGNMIGGILLGSDTEFIETKVKEHHKFIGGYASPFDVWLLNNGLKTLGLRMDKHCDNAEVVADWLNQHEKVRLVNYPGLVNNKYYLIAKKQMKRFGGMLSFDLDGGIQEAKTFMSKLNFCSLTPTLGNVDTLVLHPATSSHIKVDKNKREKFGVTDSLIRISVGIESLDDILTDLEEALAGV
jgi:methionine-gamma-lyase